MTGGQIGEGAAKSVRAAIRWGAGALSASDTPLLDARVLMKAALRCDDAGLIAREHDELSSSASDAFEAFIARRGAYEPVASIVGVKEFWGLPFEVAPGVLIPRPDSETLIEAVLQHVDDRDRPFRVLDLGVGSGCLTCALLKELPRAEAVGVDINPNAVAAARRNLQALGLAERGRIVVGNWFAPVVGRFDIIVSNPPYIAGKERAGLTKDILDYEDHRALFSGADGMDAYRLILEKLPEYLKRDGVAAIELGDGRAEAFLDLAAMTATFETQAFRDLSARQRAAVIIWR
ncbi:MAG: peptide chain release factor N(5)-glutamine methyltransferase [Pseudomonadota bacterium]